MKTLHPIIATLSIYKNLKNFLLLKTVEEKKLTFIYPTNKLSIVTEIKAYSYEEYAAIADSNRKMEQYFSSVSFFDKIPTDGQLADAEKFINDVEKTYFEVYPNILDIFKIKNCAVGFDPVPMGDVYLDNGAGVILCIRNTHLMLQT